MSSNGLKIFHINTRSIFNKISLIQNLYRDVDILCCTETWLDNRINDKLVELNDKIIFRCDRHTNISDFRKNTFGGGVCVYIAKPFSSFSNKISHHTLVCKDFEIITISIDKPNFRKMLVVCVYKPPSGKIENCITFLKQILSDPEFIKREIWILGDFNVDLLKRNDPRVISLQAFSKSKGLEQKILEITRPNRQSGSCIDLIMTNCAFVQSSGTLDDYVSDHYTVYCIRKKHKENKECYLKSARQYRNYNHDDFVNLLRAKNWTLYDNMKDLDQQWIFIKQAALEILSIMCPYKTVHVRKSSTPWITPDIFNSIKAKQDLIRIYKATKTHDTLNRMRVLRNELNSKIDKAKAAYIVNKLHLYGKHPKKFWRIINDMIKHTNAADISTMEFKNSQGIKVTKDEIPDFMNNYFATIAERTSDPNKVVYVNRQNDVHVQFDFEPPTVIELEFIVKEINDDMTSCVEGLNMKMCKRLIEAIPEKILLLYANSMFKGEFPTEWSMADVTLLPKTGDLTNPGNWRPISNTNIFSKILEKLVQRQMSNYIFNNEIISSCQYGFVPKRSTHEAVFNPFQTANANMVHICTINILYRHTFNI